MTRGKKPVAAIDDAKKFAERMGYHWQTNEHPDLLYDLFIFKPDAACIVRVRQTRYRIDTDTMYEKLIPDNLHEVRALPFPPGSQRRSGSARSTSGPCGGSGSFRPPFPRSNGEGRTITRTRTPGSVPPLGQDPLYKGG